MDDEPEESKPKQQQETIKNILKLLLKNQLKKKLNHNSLKMLKILKIKITDEEQKIKHDNKEYLREYYNKNRIEKKLILKVVKINIIIDQLEN